MRFLVLAGWVGSSALALAACTDSSTKATSGAGGATSTSSTAGGASSATASTSGDGGGGVGGIGGSSQAGGGGAGGMGTGGSGGLPWSKHFGSPGLDYGWGVAASANGDTTIQFTLTDPLDFGGGPVTPAGRNVGLARFDDSGNYLWSKGFLNTNDADPRILLDDGLGNLFLLGTMEGNHPNQDFGGPPLPQACTTNTYAAKLDDLGGHVWSQVYYSCSFNSVSDAAVDINHDLVLAGQFMGSVDFGTGTLPSAGSDDIVIAKLANDGSAVWAKRFGDSGNQNSWGIATDSDADVVACGSNQGTVDFGGGPISHVSIVGGWVAKIDKDGNHLWSRGFNNTQPNQGGVIPLAVAADSLGNTIVAGQLRDSCDFGGGVLSTAAGNIDLFIAKYDPLGTHLWSKNYGSNTAGLGGGHALEVGASDEIYVNAAVYGALDLGCGAMSGSVGGDVALARLSNSGACLWSQALQTTSPQFTSGTSFVGVKVDAALNWVVSGSFAGTLDFGAAFGGAQYPASSWDIFVGKFKP